MGSPDVKRLVRVRLLLGRITTLVFGGTLAGAFAWLTVSLTARTGSLSAGLEGAARSLALVFVIWVASWLAWGVPRLDLTPSAAVVRNPLFTWRFPWGDMGDPLRQWGLALTSRKGAKALVWAAPARSGFVVTMGPRPQAVHLRDYQADPLVLHLDATKAAAVFTEYREAVVDEVELERILLSHEDASRRPNYGQLALLTLSICWALFTLYN